tara:strand:- start:9963 stop:10190 length:228 start_codon:yes stop_codon:yes gene_type:complete
MFNVGDIVCVPGVVYTVVELDGDSRIYVRVNCSGTVFDESFDNSLFTLVTPAGPPPSVLTGMTQFFKDKEKSNVT